MTAAAALLGRLGLLGCDPGRPDGRQHVVAGVGIGHREDVEHVQLVAVFLDQSLDRHEQVDDVHVAHRALPSLAALHRLREGRREAGRRDAAEYASPRRRSEEHSC